MTPQPQPFTLTVPDQAIADVPIGYAEFPREILRPPRSLAARTYRDIRRWSIMSRGGHFAPLEQREAARP
jgi:hypothetical protein